MAECAFNKFPILLAGDHPAINFDLGITAKSKAQYFQVISNPNPYNLDKASINSVLFTALHHKNNIINNGNSLKSHFNKRTISKLGSEDDLEIANYLNEHIPEIINTTKSLIKEKQIFQ